jgi:hypothetical protein
MSNIDYKKNYEEVVFEKITIQKEFELFKKTQEEVINKLIKDNEELKEHLKKYTAPKGNKKYYEKNKEKIIEYNKKSYHDKKLQKINQVQGEDDKSNL